MYQRAKELYRDTSIKNNEYKQKIIAALSGMSYENFKKHKNYTNRIKSLLGRPHGGKRRTRKTSRHSSPILKTLFQLE